MKLLIQCNYDPQGFGGIEMVTKNLLQTLAHRDFNIEVFAGTDSDVSEQRTGYYFFGLKVIRKISGAAILRWGNWQFLRAGLRADLILFQEPFPTLMPALFMLRFLFRKRVVVLIHAIPQMPRTLARPYTWLRNLILARVPVVATTPVLLEQLKLPPESPYPRDVISLCFGEDAPKHVPMLTPDECVALSILPPRYMLFFGRMASYKGVEVLLPAIQAAPEVQFVIAGTGQLSDEVSTFIASNELKNVIFIDRRVSDAEKRHLFVHCTALLLPSTNSSEAFAITQIEAMFFGKPIINTQLHNGVNFVAPADEVALTVPPGDSEALASAIHRLWIDKDLAKQLGDRGKARQALLFSRCVFRQKWLDYFNKTYRSMQNIEPRGQSKG